MSAPGGAGVVNGHRRETARHYGKYRGTVTDNHDPRNQGRIRVHCPEILGDVDSGWALPCTPYAGDKTGIYAVPPIGAGVWVEFEAGDVSRPIWVGCWWPSDHVPTDESGAGATPDLRVARSEEGLMLALHDDSRTIALSDSSGASTPKSSRPSASSRWYSAPVAMRTHFASKVALQPSTWRLARCSPPLKPSESACEGVENFAPKR